MGELAKFLSIVILFLVIQRDQAKPTIWRSGRPGGGAGRGEEGAREGRSRRSTLGVERDGTTRAVVGACICEKLREGVSCDSEDGKSDGWAALMFPEQWFFYYFYFLTTEQWI